MKQDPNAIAAILPYTLKACQNLEQYFTAAGDKGSIMYFRQRIRELQRQMRKAGK